MPTADAERALIEWATVANDRDRRILAAHAAGISKNRIHVLTGIARTTIDRVLKETSMTTTTVLARGAYLSGDDIANGWRDFLLNDVYTPDQENAIVAALVKAQEEEFDKLLPDGCVWYPATSEIVGPVGIELGDEDEVKDLMQDAASEVAAHRASKIEAELSA